MKRSVFFWWFGDSGVIILGFGEKSLESKLEYFIEFRIVFVINLICIVRYLCIFENRMMKLLVCGISWEKGMGLRNFLRC